MKRRGWKVDASMPLWVYFAVFLVIYVGSFRPVVQYADGSESGLFQSVVMLTYLPLVALTEKADMRVRPKGGEGLLFIYD
jgi:hypothetical protein